MKNKIAVALVHGIGKECPRFADGMIRNLKRYLGEDADNCVFEPIHWAPIMQNEEDRLEKAMKTCKEIINSNGTLGVQRKLMIDYIADGIAYQPLSKNKRGIYDDIHTYYANRLKVLTKKAGENALLCVISHSLGTIISSNYFYDLQNRKKKPKLVSKKVNKERQKTPLENGETLCLFYTMGSPIALWTMRYKDFGQPITFPSLSEDVKEMYPGIKEKTEWINICNKSDPISYPLKVLSDKYYNEVTEDLFIKGNIPFFRSTSASHVFYWGDKSIAKRIAGGIRRVIVGG